MGSWPIAQPPEGGRWHALSYLCSNVHESMDTRTPENKVIPKTLKEDTKDKSKSFPPTLPSIIFKYNFQI